MVYCKKIEFVIYGVVSCNLTMCDDNNWFDYIKNNKDKPWNYEYLSANPNVTWEMVKFRKNKKSKRNNKWDYSELSIIPILLGTLFRQILTNVGITKILVKIQI